MYKIINLMIKIQNFKIIIFGGLVLYCFTFASFLKAQELNLEAKIQLPQIITYLNNDSAVKKDKFLLQRT